MFNYLFMLKCRLHEIVNDRNHYKNSNEPQNEDSEFTVYCMW